MTPTEVKALADRLLQNRGGLKALSDMELSELYEKFGTFPDTNEPLTHMYRQLGHDAQKILDGRKADSQFERVLRQGRVSARVARVSAVFAAIGALTAFVPTIWHRESKPPHKPEPPQQIQTHLPPDSPPATIDPWTQTPILDAPAQEPKAEPAIDPLPKTPKPQ